MDTALQNKALFPGLFFKNKLLSENMSSGWIKPWWLTLQWKEKVGNIYVQFTVYLESIDSASLVPRFVILQTYSKKRIKLKFHPKILHTKPQKTWNSFKLNKLSTIIIQLSTAFTHYFVDEASSHFEYDTTSLAHLFLVNFSQNLGCARQNLCTVQVQISPEIFNHVQIWVLAWLRRHGSKPLLCYLGIDLLEDES